MSGAFVQFEEGWLEIDQRSVIVETLQRYLAAAQIGLLPTQIKDKGL
jgi:hypothetical protein